MSTAYIISIAIVVLALIALVVGGVMVYKKISTTMDSVSEVQSNAETQIDHFTKTTDAINERVNHINERVTAMTEIAKDKQETFAQFTEEASDFGESITYLKEQAPEISKSIAQNSYERAKEEGPSKAKMVREVATRTLDKQKRRYASD